MKAYNSESYFVIVYNNGNDIYECLENTWYICGYINNKVKLINEDKSSIIEKISKWKIMKKPFQKNQNKIIKLYI